VHVDLPNADAYSERELLLLVANGNKNAFRLLFQTYWNQVYGAALHLTKSPEQARDLCQDIFLKLWDRRAELPGVKKMTTYLYVITRNLFYDQLRKQVLTDSNREFLMTYFDRETHTPFEQMEQKELGNTLHNAINRLPPQLKEVFVMKKLEGLSHEEIGRRLNISALSAKTYMTRALLLLRQYLRNIT